MPESLYEKVVEVDERVVIHDRVKLVQHNDGMQPEMDTAITNEQVTSLIDRVPSLWTESICQPSGNVC